MASSRKLFEIRCFPKLESSDRRYPVSYTHNQNFTVFTVPVGNLKCSPSCYFDSEEAMFSMEGSANCPACNKSGNIPFIDMGLMTLIQKNKLEIQKKRYSFVILDSQNRVISWESVGNPFLSRLSKYISDNILTKLNENVEKINYLRMKYFVRSKFTSLFTEMKTRNPSRVITWCRADLRSDQTFTGVMLNESMNSDKFKVLKFIDDLGTEIAFEGKHTHINYVSSQNIFIILRCNGASKTIDAFVADLTQGVIDNKLKVTETRIDGLQFRTWFSTFYNSKNQSIYILGGEYPIRDTRGGIARITDIKWDGSCLRADFVQEYTFRVGRLMNCTGALWLKKKNMLMMGGGVTLKDKPSKYDPIIHLFSYEYKNQSDGDMNEVQESTCKMLGANSKMIEIPQVGKDGGVNTPGGLLLFAGSFDYKTDLDRRELSKLHLWQYHQRQVQVASSMPNGKNECSNLNYPFLFESTGALVRRNNNEFYVRALIPCKSSNSKQEKAYLLEYNLQTKTFAEYMITERNIIK